MPGTRITRRRWTALLVATFGLAAASPASAQADRARTPEQPESWPAYEAAKLPAGALTFDGSTIASPVVEAWNEAFRTHHPGVEITSSISGSGGGAKRAAGGAVSFASVFGLREDDELRELTRGRKTQLAQIVLGWKAFAVVVPKDSPIRSLDADQVAAAFFGGVPPKTWGDAGVKGPAASLPVHLIASFGEGDASALAEMVEQDGNRLDRRDDIARIDDAGEFAARVAEQAGAVGLVVAGRLPEDDRLRTLPVGNGRGGAVLPEAQPVVEGRYPLGKPIALLVVGREDPREAALQQAYLRHAFSAEGQRLMNEQGWSSLTLKQAQGQLKRLGISIAPGRR